jgi:nitrate reductase cytochrome c-type subunit
MDITEIDLDLSEFDIDTEEAVVKRVGKQYCVFSESGRKLGCYSSRRAAQERLKQIEMFKHMKNDEAEQEFSKEYCFCMQCHHYYYAPLCHTSRCPICDEPDDITRIG